MIFLRTPRPAFLNSFALLGPLVQKHRSHIRAHPCRIFQRLFTPHQRPHAQHPTGKHEITGGGEYDGRCEHDASESETDKCGYAPYECGEDVCECGEYPQWKGR
ncbi:hypothetical protein V565_110370 [Rhizoctonia solani 123E]|uniref:Uncharacterized protein n=1 Tax=Rhizoctonia solani 123E TaxID=1423351 RepID=A0A074RPK9_9AGAM|nr:hypothetical protein V565_110370 [Rhizoctonia solani 123E]